MAKGCTVQNGEMAEGRNACMHNCNSGTDYSKTFTLQERIKIAQWRNVNDGQRLKGKKLNKPRKQTLQPGSQFFFQLLVNACNALSWIYCSHRNNEAPSKRHKAAKMETVFEESACETMHYLQGLRQLLGFDIRASQ
jgi:hypothetical protein